MRSNSLYLKVFFYFGIVLVAFSLMVGVVFTKVYSDISMSSYREQLGEDAVKIAEKVSVFVRDDDYSTYPSFIQVLEAIEKPQSTWNNLVDVCENVLKHEQYVTSCINHLMGVAIEEKDYASNSFLTWYVNEQIEEEANADELCKKTKFAGDDKNAILLLNEKLAERK